ncbi:hypothetical protein GCM10010116_60170 [Microbispora rosea subsp. aerata]|nr:His/Gly/Thr/Pro-type tRNA ligase C-terminal domain-containing protein [Microbispora rosea]GGO30027.1 hypothetical protein GCM10010116_60170 [Microbispora rosea subsp. aerata]GIH59016.1 hypothetical protein Mro02_59300 [Microbispora rosea subsp. aerata]GLJ87357.1 hypothetical protein GCM10017588_61020 [Microbispora rosea subsp. aerata]
MSCSAGSGRARARSPWKPAGIRPGSSLQRSRCTELGLRAEVSGPEHGSLGARVRAARLVPYQAVIGAKEAGSDLVALRLRDGRALEAMPAAEALARIGAVAAARSAELWEPALRP